MATTRLKPIGHDDRLSIVEHLTELRTRIIICVIALQPRLRHLPVAGGPDPRRGQPAAGRRRQREAVRRDARPARAGGLLAAVAEEGQRAARGHGGGAGRRRRRGSGAAGAGRCARERRPRPPWPARRRARRSSPSRSAWASRSPPRSSPRATSRSCSSLPLILWQAYAFILPAFSPTERQVAFPLMLMVPFLFYAGVVFAYFLVLPAAVDFLQNFNDDNYDVLLQARDYNKFAVMVMGVMGLLFQLPVVILAVTRMGIVTPQQLRKQRRYRDPGHRRPGRAAARRRPRDDAPDDAPDPRPLRRLYPSRRVARASPDARPRTGGGRDGLRARSLRLRRLMLFDLRGSGRRRVVKIVYVTLAILMGGGLVLFGIGGSGALSGGLLDAITESSGGTDDGNDRFRTLEQQAVAKARAGPDRGELGGRRPRPLQPRADGRIRRPGHRQLHGRGRRDAPLRRPGLGRERGARRRQSRSRAWPA